MNEMKRALLGVALLIAPAICLPDWQFARSGMTVDEASKGQAIAAEWTKHDSKPETCVTDDASRRKNSRDDHEDSEDIVGSFSIQAHVAFEDWQKPSGVSFIVQKVVLDGKEDGSPSEDGSSFEYFVFGLVYGRLYADVTSGDQATDCPVSCWNNALSVPVPFTSGDGFIGMAYNEPAGTFKFYTSPNGWRWSPLAIYIIDPNPPDRTVRMATGGVARIEFGITSYDWGWASDPNGFDPMPVDIYSASVELENGRVVAECDSEHED